MATQIFRVARVLTAAASPVARLQGVDQNGHEIRLEVPVALVHQIAAGHLLVVNWSVHALPEQAPAVAEAPPVATQVAAQVSAPSGRAVDDAFMELMSRVPRGAPAARDPLTTSPTPPTSQPRSGPEIPEINDEFHKLLGSTRTKG